MDLAIGAKDVFVMMTLFTKDGAPKLVRDVHLPADRRGAASAASTPTSRPSTSAPDGVTVVETFGTTVDELAARLDLGWR